MQIIRLADTDAAVAARQAAAVLEAGGIVLYPTDTLYGLAVDAFNLRALTRLRELKGRERMKPISVVVPHIKAIDDHALLEGDARLIAEKHLPGALTLVLPARTHIPKELAVDGMLRVRIPNAPFTDALAHRYPRPFTATSANRSGLLSPASVPDIFAQFGRDIIEIDLVIDGGVLDTTVASTVLRFDSGAPLIVREGALSKEDLGL